jgi:methyl-accepting chemotaxis protein
MTFKRLRLSNIAFTLKFLIVPGIAVALMCVLAYFGTAALSVQVDQTHTIVDRNLEGAIRLSDVAARVQAINGDLFRTLSRQAAGGSTDNAKAFTSLQAALDRVLADLAVYRTQYADPANAGNVATIETELNKYKEATGFVAQMLEIDFASGVSFMEPFEANFVQLSKLINTMVAETADASRALAVVSAREAETTQTLFIVMMITATLTVALLAWLIGRTTARSIARIADATLRLARADTDIELDRLTRSDELGAIVESLAVFRDNVVKVRQMQDEQEQLQAEAEADRRRTLAELADSFEASVRQVVQTVAVSSDGLKSSAATMRETADGAYRQSSDVANAGLEVSSNVATVATAVEEMSASIGEIARQVADSARIARGAVERARQTDRTIGELAEVASRIGDIIALIHGIAGQTNLLALNATIEAARAGEHGKGFAVVASEVKSLANQTGKATEEISAQIEAIQSRTKDSVEAIRLISETIEQMNGITGGIASAVEQQAAATQEISRNVQQAASSTGAVSHTISDVRDAARMVGSSADEVLEAAENLSTQSNSLSNEVNAFLARVRA